jgi:hypothetical protein
VKVPANKEMSDWLESLGMSEYAQRFAENAIDVSVLRYLTDQDLEKIGVLLGHRRKMLAAIAKLGDTSTAVALTRAPQPPPSLVVPTTPMSEVTGERRHITVMFCDLVDSTGIAAKLDAEEWRDLVGAYLDDASAAVTEMGGKVAKNSATG